MARPYNNSLSSNPVNGYSSYQQSSPIEIAFTAESFGNNLTERKNNSNRH